MKLFGWNFLMLVFLFTCCLSVQAGANDVVDHPLQREDFAYGMDLKVSGDYSIYGLNVPAAVYRGCTRADLGDLRVFNVNHPVPHLLRAQVAQKIERPAQALPFFPLIRDGQNRGDAPPDLHIATNSQGTIIDIRQNTPGQRNPIVSAYILDTSRLEYSADWLEFTWEGQGEQFSTSVSLDVSNDLSTWHTHVSSVPLTELRFGGHMLLRKRIAVPQGIHRKIYLRLSWPAGKDGVQLTSAIAGYNREEQDHPRTKLSLEGEVLPVTEHGALHFQYDSKGFFPVDQLKVLLPEDNSLAQVVVFSRSDEESSWKRRASVLAYRLVVDGVPLDNGTISMKRSTDRYWRLEIDTNSGTQQAPILELGWLPGQLVFMAQGVKPYTLAYGRAGLDAAQYQVDRLLGALDPLNRKQLVALAHAGPQQILGGDGLLEVSGVFPWSRWLLWVVLLSGVLVVGGMALRLYREMNER